MNPIIIAELVLSLERMIAGVYQIINNAGLSSDETQSYIARIMAVQQTVPEPLVG